MTFSEILGVLFVISGIVCLLATITFRLQRRWLDIDQWVHNSVGNTVAYSSLADFKGGRLCGRFVLARDTVIFGDPAVAKNAFPFSGNKYSFHMGYARHEPSLFVPGVSERYCPFQEQAQFVRHLPNDSDLRRQFWSEKLKANCAIDYRIKLCYWITKRSGVISSMQVVSAIAAIVSGLILVCVMMNNQDRRERNTPSVYYTTTSGSSEITEINGTKDELGKLPMTDSMAVRHDIMTGPITEVMSIGGGLSVVCLNRQSDSYRICGFTAVGANLQKGGTAYLRYGWTNRWTNTIGNSDGTGIYWAITEQEAQALLQKGFELVR